jgi:hypothetical protein
MKNSELLDLYSDYLISPFGQATATGFSALLRGAISHGQTQRWLAGEERTSADLWQGQSSRRFAKSRARMG